MIKELITNITETIEGYEVKNLRWLPIDNIIVGLVKDPILANPKLNNGFIAVTWKRNGKPTNKYGGANRSDLTLKINWDNLK